MANSMLMQEYKNEWILYRGDSVFTPAVCLSSSTDIEIRFELRVANKFYYTYVNEEFSVHAHLQGLNVGMKLTVIASLCYSSNKQVFGYFQKEIDYGAPEPMNLGVLNMKVYYMNEKTLGKMPHFTSMETSGGAVILKCQIFVSGHLGSVASYIYRKKVVQTQPEYVRNFNSAFESQPHERDLKINVEGQCVPVHKNILVSQSPVFKKMMDQQYLESKTNTITISDFSFKSVDCFVKYLYTGEVSTQADEDIEELYALADKYDVKSLRQECVRIMSLELNLNNVCKLLQRADEIGDNEVKAQLKHFAVENFKSLESTLEWGDLVKSHCHLTYDILARVYHLSCHLPKSK